MPKKYFFAVLFLGLGAAAMGRAVTPMDYYQTLVAGGRNQGYVDGAFSLARFNEPLGLALDDAGHKLYVADSGNHRIRVVDLDHNNEVGTLAGTGAAGSKDGALSTATFKLPTQLAVLPGGRLAVFDMGNGIRLIDLQKQTVSTLAKGVNLWNMVYQPQNESLYFSRDNNLQKLDLKSLAVTSVLSGDIQVPSPGALCLFQGKVCVADLHLPGIYQVDLGGATSQAALSLVGNAKDVRALASSGKDLYALERDGLWVKAGLPDSQTVDFPTPWGFLFNNEDHGGQTALFTLQPDMPVGFSASLTEPHKFYIAGENLIVSVKDYHFEKWWYTHINNDSGLTDYDYPGKKPTGTFRILLVGASRNSTAYELPLDRNQGIDEDAQTPKSYTYAKRLELALNTEAALRNSNAHFEVLNLTRRGDVISSFGYYEVPGYVEKFDIDLVLVLADEPGYMFYFLRPLTAQGVPSEKENHDYTLQPLSARAPAGPAADLLKRCRELKVPVSEKQDFPGDGYWSLLCGQPTEGDAHIQEDMREMDGKPLGLLQDKLNSMKTSEGHTPGLAFFYVPGGHLLDDCSEAFWNGVCAQYHLKMLDLSEPFNALRIAYDPVYVNHFTAYGNDLVALLLKQSLIGNKLIPLGTGD